MKGIGIALISLIPILIGFLRAAELEKNEKRKAALIEFLNEIHFQILNFNRGQKELYQNFENKILEEEGFLPHLRSETASEPWGAFERAIERFLQNVSYSSRAKQALYGFSKRFGMQSKDSQLSDLNQILLCLREEIEKESASIKNRAKISRMTGFTAGLGIFILLI